MTLQLKMEWKARRGCLFARRCGYLTAAHDDCLQIEMRDAVG